MLVLLSAAGMVYTGWGAWSMVVCLGTAGVIVFAPMWVGAGLARPALSFFGTISYSLYLIHVLSGVNYFFRSTTIISTDDDNYKLADGSVCFLH